MVNFHHPLMAFIALSSSVAAVPAASSEAAAPFTFVQWIEDIIADPYGDHLSPEDAVKAKNEAVANANPLTKRARCQEWMKDAPAPDAAACLQYLARLGSQGVQCGIGQNQHDIQMCRIGRAEVVSTKSERSAQSTNCNEIARTGGLIFDGCWRADNTVKGSEICAGNSLIQVNILGV